MSEIPISGVRLYAYYEDAERSTVGTLDATRYIVLSDPVTSVALAIVEEHWTYAIRSTAAAILACKWMANPDPRVLGLVGVGTMGTTALQCLAELYDFEEIRCTSRRAETREAFAEEWSSALGVPVTPVASIEEVVRGADIAVGGTTSKDIVSREEWLKPGATFVSLARRELDPAGWPKMDKIVIDDFDINMLTPSSARPSPTACSPARPCTARSATWWRAGPAAARARTNATSSTPSALSARTSASRTTSIKGAGHRCGAQAAAAARGGRG